MKTIILFGFKSSGKTFLGNLLSQELQRPFIDTDERIMNRYSKEKLSIREIYGRLGEVLFRDVEKTIVHQLEKGTGAIIALGGGAILNPDNADHLQSIGTLVYLKASFETIQSRMKKQEMPLFAGKSDSIGSLRQIYNARLPIYESIPALSLDIDRFDTDACIQKLSQYGL